jgi:hypothetical protein
LLCSFRTDAENNGEQEQMAFDAVPGGDPRGPWCPRCGLPIGESEPKTIMHFHADPDGRRGLSGKPWHAECARPFWDKLSGAMDALRRAAGSF